jgi:sugar lactone lactonase YvrE
MTELLGNVANLGCFLAATMLKSLKRLNSSSALIRALLYASATGYLFCASSVLAQAPPVVADAQQTIGSGYSNPRSVAAGKKGAVYVADQNNNRVLQLITSLPGASTQTQVATTGYTLAGPTALAVDDNGDLFIGDYPSVLGIGVTRIIECLATNGVLNGNVNLIYQGGLTSLLSQPNSLAVDRKGIVYVGVTGLAAGIYSIASGSGTATNLNITGLPAGFTPAALVRDASTGLYFVNSAASSGGVYFATLSGTEKSVAIPVNTQTFSPGRPSGLALDSSGDLFVLSQLAINGTTSAQVMDIPGDSPTTPYLIPSAGLGTTSGMALEPNGNIDVAELANGLVTQLDYLNPINLGSAPVFRTGTVVPFNFEFNTATTLAGFQAVTVGDLGLTNSDVVPATGGDCTDGALSGTAYEPFICSQPFQATPQYTGTRVSAIQVKGPSSEVLASSPVHESGRSGAEVIYPLSATATATPLAQPQGIAISGFDQTLYIADFASGLVYAAGGPGGTALSTVDTGNIVLVSPSAVVMNGEGDLYIADFGLSPGQGEVIVVPTKTGKAPSVVDTGLLVQHPISLALDYLGNLYVGDAGGDGDGATSSSPGYVVKVPHNGSPQIVTIPGVSIVFPQALATSEANASLYIGDGGDGATTLGQVVNVSADGTTASVVSFTGETTPTNPTGLSVDAAGDLYVLDGTANTITVAPSIGNSYLVSFANSLLSAPSALVSSAGGQSFVIANIGNGTSNSLIYLNGNNSVLAFGDVTENTNSAAGTFNLYNIGNIAMKLKSPSYTLIESPSVFSALSGFDCSNGLSVAPSTSCTGSMQFSPTALQTYTGQLSITSNAYNSGTPVLNLSGTGTAAGAIAFPGRDEARNDQMKMRSPSSIRPGRKSFHKIETRPRAE